MPPDEPTEEEALEELPEDNGTPFQPATDGRGDLSDQNLDREIENSKTDDTDPDYDTDVEQEELYDEGLEKDKPNAGDTVVGYDPENDERLKKHKKK